jgi:hypothetical protein
MSTGAPLPLAVPQQGLAEGILYVLMIIPGYLSQLLRKFSVTLKPVAAVR